MVFIGLGLSNEDILRILNPKPKLNPKPSKLPKYTPRVTVGPLKWRDREMRCENVYRSKEFGEMVCHTPTHYEVESKPLCAIHALEALNQMIHELTEIRRKDLMG